MPEISGWEVDNPAVSREEFGSETISLSHPNYPATAHWDGADAGTLQLIAAQYLAKVADDLDLPDIFKPGTLVFAVPLAWMKIPIGGETQVPDESSWLVRYRKPLPPPTEENPHPPPTEEIDRSIMLMAVESLKADDLGTRLGSRHGLGVTAHLSLEEDGRWLVCITSVARSIGLPAALASRGVAAVTLQSFYSFVFTPTFFADIKVAIQRLAGLETDTEVAINGVRGTPSSGSVVLAEIYATATRSRSKPATLPYGITVRFLYDGSGPGRMEVEKVPLVANAVERDMFVRDPASRAGLGAETRPNRSAERLDNFVDADVELNGVYEYGGNVELDDVDYHLAQVMQSVFVDKAADETQPEVVMGPDWPSRSNAFAALNAYGHARGTFDDRYLRSLFDTIIAFGIPPSAYFKFAVLPLHIRYRSGIRPGPGKDGKTVNAQADFDPPESDEIGPQAEWDPNTLKPLQVRFGLADLKRTCSNRDALGLACDARWAWHEYCHVLLAARTGMLELSFVHSAGDALAAIVSDPWSELAARPRARGYTFPWAHLHRRHDRSVFEGWSWSGSRHRPNRFVWKNCNCRHKGYDSEQILSTSLFRLYLALGGDTVDAAGEPDRAARQRAADYTVYLILWAIRILPPASTGLPWTPQQLVTLLRVADVGTWSGSGPLEGRVGGWAHKVVRWAFEAQGLYATGNPDEVVDGPGRPPQVDIFIDTRRPPSDGPYDRGGYMPVSLDWHGGGDRPWHALPDSLQVVAGQVVVKVRNRGRTDAANVRVKVWCIEWGAGDPPPWGDPTAPWTYVGQSPANTVPKWSSGVSVSFGPLALPYFPSGTRLLILAEADCLSDPANINPLTWLPCSVETVPVIDIVSGDNNLGLRVYRVP